MVDATLGSVLKYHEDVERVRDAGLRELVGEARGASEAAGDAVARKLVTFGRILREAGLEVGPGRLQDALRGLDAVDLAYRDQVYHALRCTLVSRHDDIEPFDAAFAAFWERAPRAARRQRPPDLGIEMPAAPDAAASVPAPSWRDAPAGRARRTTEHGGGVGRRPTSCCATATSPHMTTDGAAARCAG